MEDNTNNPVETNDPVQTTNPIQNYRNNITPIIGLGWGINILAWIVGTSGFGEYAIFGIIGCVVATIIGFIKKDWYLAVVSVFDIAILWSYMQDINAINDIMKGF